MQDYILKTLIDETSKLDREYDSVVARYKMALYAEIQRRLAVIQCERGLMDILQCMRDWCRGKEDRDRIIKRFQIYFSDSFGVDVSEIIDVTSYGYSDKAKRVTFKLKDCDKKFCLVIPEHDSSYWLSDPAYILDHSVEEYISHRLDCKVSLYVDESKNDKVITLKPLYSFPDSNDSDTFFGCLNNILKQENKNA